MIFFFSIINFYKNKKAGEGGAPHTVHTLSAQVFPEGPPEGRRIGETGEGLLPAPPIEEETGGNETGRRSQRKGSPGDLVPELWSCHET